jgi:hypothetical protein
MSGLYGSDRKYANTAREDGHSAEARSLEPLVGRETGGDTSFGKKHSQARVYWNPGSTIDTEKTFQIEAR